MSGLHFSAREKNIFVLFLMVCGVYALYSGIVRPVAGAYQNVDTAIRQTREQLAKGAKVIQRDRRLAAQFQGELESLRQKLPNEQVMSGILSEVEVAAGGLPVRVTEMKPREVQEENLSKKFSVGLAVEGNMEAIMRFVHTLQSPPHSLLVPEFYIQKAFHGPGILSAKFVVTRFLID